MDAGATNIEIRLKESGTLLLEVIDNGHGVREIDFQGLSKLSFSKNVFINAMSKIICSFTVGSHQQAECSIGYVEKDLQLQLLYLSSYEDTRIFNGIRAKSYFIGVRSKENLGIYL